MAGDASRREAPTRRRYVKHGGAAGASLLAVCAGDSRPVASPTEFDRQRVIHAPTGES